MYARFRTGFLLFLYLLPFWSAAQDISNKGKDFWIGYGNHVRMYNGNPTERMQLYITSDVSTTGQVTIAGINFSQSFTVTANQITTIDIPRSASLRDDGIFNYGIHVTAERPVVVYSFIFVSAVSGATVCLPTNTLGRDYYSVNYAQRSNETSCYSYFFVIAADTGATTIEVTPSAATRGGKAANVPFLVTLQQGEIYNVLGNGSGTTGVDLTGSRIRSMNMGTGCKRIAVFCGSSKINIGCTGDGTSDNLYQQMYPTATWGKKYITIPSFVNGNNYFRIVKSDPSAVVTLNGSPVDQVSFINNFYYEFSNSSTNIIESDKPVLVAQYFPTQGCGGNTAATGDPEMIYLNPVEQTISAVTLNSMQPSGVNINTHYLNVLLKNNPAAINTFKIDGNPYTQFTPVPGDNGYAYAQINTSAGTHNITCDTGFNIIAYGFGQYESYGFSGGTNLKDLYQFISIRNKYSIVDYPATCTDAPFNFSMTFPYMPTKVQWVFNGLYPDVSINAPVPDSTWTKNGKQLYLYRLTDTYMGPAPGVYPIKIIATNPTIDGCTGEQEISFDLQVYPKPLAGIGVTGSGCLGDSSLFTDQSVTGDNHTIRWFWDLGNGDASAVKNPPYLYKAVGTYDVSLWAITMVGCITDTTKKQVAIHPLPVAAFQSTGPYCAGQEIALQDLSTLASGTITQYTWSMGNGDTLTQTSNNLFKYTYPQTGNYTITLTATSDAACSSNPHYQPMVINAVPDAGFRVPENCLTDPFSQFTDTTTIADGTQASFQYAWHFGDARATAADNVSALKDPRHKYTTTGEYTVSLKVTSNQGCADSLQQIISINGTAPQSIFTIDNTLVCSNQPTSFVDNSVVDIGRIVRLEIYWDYNNDPTKKTIDEEPANGKRYSYQYPELFTPDLLNYTVKVVAYSGESCLSTSNQTVTMRAIPQLQFNPIPPVCADVTPFQITQASVINTMSGQAVYSGPGVSSTGLFNPSLVTPGIDSLQYTFRGSNSCVNSIKQAMQVYALPEVNAGTDQYLLEGRSTTIAASASGIDMQYAWTPQTALDNATLLQPAASPTDDIIYRLTVTTGEGCKASDDMKIIVLKLPRIPNAFSPNGDGIHDRWEIKHLSTYPGATVEIYNRYGQLVFKTTGYTQGWDGTYQGKPLPVGTYYYIINPKHGREQMAGYVDIIR